MNAFKVRPGLNHLKQLLYDENSTGNGGQVDAYALKSICSMSTPPAENSISKLSKCPGAKRTKNSLGSYDKDSLVIQDHFYLPIRKNESHPSLERIPASRHS